MTKRLFKFATLVFLFIIVLVACNEKENKSSNEDQTAEEQFIGTISEIDDKTAIISIEEGAILASGNLVAVDLSVNSHEQFLVGDKVEVTYDGIIRESHPLGINTLSVIKIQ